MKKLLLLVLIPLFLLSAEIFPHTSEQFKAYSIGAGGFALGYKVSEIFTDHWWIKYPCAFLVSGSISMMFDKHMEGQEKWNCVGRGQTFGFYVTCDLLTWWRRSKEKPKLAYAEEHYDEIIEYGLE